MAVYEYRAIAKKSGKAAKGVIDADSPAAARRKLREQELYPTEIQEAEGAVAASSVEAARKARLGLGRVSLRDVAMMTRQLAVLFRAGMPMVEALTALLDQTSKPRMVKVIYDVRDRVNAGSSLSDALARHPRVFSQLYTNMVRAGESSGTLEQVMFRLTDILERHAKLRARILSTLAYPVFMGLFAVGIIVFLMVIIVPRLTLIFQKQEQELPTMTKTLIGVSHFVALYWWLILLVVLGVLLLWRLWVSSKSGRMRWDRFKLMAPVFGVLHTKVVCGRFARTLGTMLDSGLTMMKALDVVRTVIGNRVVEEAMADVKAGVRRGKDLAQPLKETGLFPPMLIHMVELGQRSGEIESMLLNVADNYDDDVQMTVDAIVGLIEPVIIIFMGVFVGFLVLSILLPILNMSQNI